MLYVLLSYYVYIKYVFIIIIFSTCTSLCFAILCRFKVKGGRDVITYQQEGGGGGSLFYNFVC